MAKKKDNEEGIKIMGSSVSTVYGVLDNRDKDHVWAFCAGQYSQDFRGNPKYLFIYINKYRPDIYAYWLCNDKDTLELVRSLGYDAYELGTAEAAAVIEHTGVLVAEQVKAVIPAGLEQAKYLNLWHGVGGVKAVERSIREGQLVPELAKKYITQNEYYRTYELYLAPSPFIEDIAKAQLGLSDAQIIRAGYPRDIYQKNYERVETFDHRIIENRNLPSDTKMAVYIPTRREFENSVFFSEAIPDMEKLISVCEKKHILLIFKMHPYYENDKDFLRAKEVYADCPWVMFWDNSDDIYEILDMIDLCIMDYSSMFTDMIVAGCKHYIRYNFDFDENDLEFPKGYDDVTVGEKCKTFDDLLVALENYRKRNNSAKIKKIRELYWEYETPDSMDVILDKTIAFEPVNPQLPILYSFDIFDTVFSRKVLDPVGVFYRVKEYMESSGDFPTAFVRNYPKIRRNTELVVREFYKKSKDIRNSEKVEIHFDEIFDRMASVYDLNEEQVSNLKKWELETELDNVIPVKDQIKLIKKYKKDGHTVILISDMYLPKEFIRKMLKKADAALGRLPLYLSNEYGVLKAHKDLYYEVYNSFEPFYDFKKWIHYGDNVAVDQTAARQCGVNTRLVKGAEFNEIQKALTENLQTYDSYLTAALLGRMCHEAVSDDERFVISYITLIMVPYIDWVLRDAVRKGFETLYFVSRDGHPLKRIADAIIKERGLEIKTKYIYASRRTWRIPSFITEVDPCFWEPYANFGDIVSKEKLLRAMNLDENLFEEFFPDINLDEIDFTNKKELNELIERFKISDNYNDYLLKLAAEERVLVSGYLKQEIDQKEKFALVEYWGRGYTQDTMVRLWQDITGKKTQVPFYYTRTVLPTIGDSLRYNFTTHSAEQFFIEGFFANMPYKSVEKYEERNGRIEPVIEPITYNREIYDAMEKFLPEFAKRFASLDLVNPEDTDHMLYEFALDYYMDNRENPFFAEFIGRMVDSVAAYGKKREFAPPLTEKTLQKLEKKEILRGDSKLTTSITMSIVRSDDKIRQKYFDLYQILPGDNLTSGRPLSESERAQNEKFKKQYETLSGRAKTFKEYYDEFIDNIEVKNVIYFVVNGKSLDEVGLNKIKKRVNSETGYECKELLLGTISEKEDKEVARKVAEARFIVAVNPIMLFADVKWREETDMILLRNVPFNLYNAGLTSYRFLKWEEKYVRLCNSNDVSVIQVPSDEVGEQFRMNYSGSSTTDCNLLGSMITDCYYDEDFKNTARRKLNKVFPAASGKKVILYMPSFRLRRGYSDWISMLDMRELQKRLGDEYVVVINFSKNVNLADYKNIIDIIFFSKLINAGNKMLSVREMMCAADVIVGDYRDTFFESALLDKPVFSTAWDYEDIIKSKNMSNNANDFEQFIFAPIVRNVRELAEALKNIKEYDYSAKEAFRKKYFSGCDGRSEERVLEYLKNKYELTEAEKIADAEWVVECKALNAKGSIFAKEYKKAVKKTDVSPKVVILTDKKSIKNTGLQLVEKQLQDNTDVEVLTLNEDNMKEKKFLKAAAEKTAAAGVVLVGSEFPGICNTVFRDETRVIMLRDTSYPLYFRHGLKKYVYPGQAEFERLKGNVNMTHIQLPGQKQRDVFLNRYCGGRKDVDTSITGCCATDVYFDRKFEKNSRKKLLSLFPQFKNKKIVLFIPSINNVKGAKRDELPLNLEKLKKLIPDEYAILLNLNAKQKKKLKKELVIPEEYAEMITGLTPREMIVASNVVVGDYRDSFFEAAIARKPCFSTAYDAEAVVEASNGSLTIEDVWNSEIGPLVKNEKELAGYLEKIDGYDFSKMDNFREEYLEGCDGKSTLRVVKYIENIL